MKGARQPEERAGLLAHLEKRFGKLSQTERKFTHVGVEHEQDPHTNEVRMHQATYVEQPRLTSLDAVATADPEQPVDDDLKGCFCTLLGGVAWLCLTCLAIAVYVAYLQRRFKAPLVRHLRDLNWLA